MMTFIIHTLHVALGGYETVDRSGPDL